MVRRVWQNRLVRGLARYPRLFFRWLLIWLAHLFRRARLGLQAGSHLVFSLVRPRNPNNLYLISADEGAMESPEGLPAGFPDPPEDGAPRTALLWAVEGQRRAGTTNATALSLWRGERQLFAEEAQAGAAAANRRYAYFDLLATQIRRMEPKDIQQLDELIARLARKWLDEGQSFEQYQRRSRLDVGRTLRYNIPRYGGRILNFRWANRERPIPRRVRPAKLLLIGDVSRSIAHYVSIILFFFHKLNFYFTVDSYVFSEHATHSAPYLNGVGTFEERVKRLVEAASSWNAGTKFGSSLKEIAQQAVVDENTWVIIATDGKVALKGDEFTLIEQHMRALKDRARGVIFLTPSAHLSGSGRRVDKSQRLGSLKYGFREIPIYQVGPPLWYGTLGEYADRLYLVRTVQDLINMTDNLIMATR